MRSTVIVLTAALFLYCPTVHAASSHRKSELEYARAIKVRAALEAKPCAARTRYGYERALQSYRAVYHGDPASPDASRAIAAVADLLTSAGRCFHDKKLSHDAIGQWEFLRRQYPGSSLRQRALFQEAQIEEFDLHHRDAARKIYRSFLKQYPHDPLAEQARASLNGTPIKPEADTAIAARRTPQPAASERIAQKMQAKSGPSAATAASPADFAERAVPRSATGAETAVLSPAAVIQSATIIQSVRYWAEGNSTRLAIDMNAAVPHRAYRSQDGRRITLIFFGARLSDSLKSRRSIFVRDPNLRSIHVGNLTGDQSELVLVLHNPSNFSSFVLSNPDRLILDVRAAQSARNTPDMAQTEAKADPPPPQSVHRRTRVETASPAAGAILASSRRDAARSSAMLPVASPSRNVDAAAKTQTPPVVSPAETTAQPAEPVASAEPNAEGQRSMARVLGLRVRRIVIDAGHGGHDSGTLGPDGLEEKDVALDIALRLGRLLRQRLGADVIYTRRTDKFVSLAGRTAIANRAHADLFISIHANSSSDPDVRGVETYFLNFTASPDAWQVAARENATSRRSVHELSDLVRKITLTDKIDESREFAADVQQSLYDGLAPGNPDLKNRGVKQAPFAVLIGANMPSILAEVSFLTNPEDARELAQPAYRERLAEALYRGVAQYVEGMSGVRVAQSAQPKALATPDE